MRGARRPLLLLAAAAFAGRLRGRRRSRPRRSSRCASSRPAPSTPPTHKLVMKAMLNVLQDDGYVVKNAVVDLGLITATKEIDVAPGRSGLDGGVLGGIGGTVVIGGGPGGVIFGGRSRRRATARPRCATSPATSASSARRPRCGSASSARCSTTAATWSRSSRSTIRSSTRTSSRAWTRACFCSRSSL